MERLLKIAQLGGALLMAAGVASCTLGQTSAAAWWWMAGGLLYGGARLWAWLR